MDTGDEALPSAFPARRAPGPADWLRGFERLVRHAPDRLLHRARRRVLLERLRAQDVPNSILFVCLGNICRSPYAALRLAQVLPGELQGKIRIASAGILGSGRLSPAEAVAVAAARGTDLSLHRSNAVTQENLRAAALVVVMDSRQRQWICLRFGRDSRTVILLGDLDPEPIDTRAIRDPIQQPVEVFREVYERIDRCVEALAAEIAGTPR